MHAYVSIYLIYLFPKIHQHCFSIQAGMFAMLFNRLLEDVSVCPRLQNFLPFSFLHKENRSLYVVIPSFSWTGNALTQWIYLQVASTVQRKICVIGLTGLLTSTPETVTGAYESASCMQFFFSSILFEGNIFPWLFVASEWKKEKGRNKNK